MANPYAQIYQSKSQSFKVKKKNGAQLLGFYSKNTNFKLQRLFIILVAYRMENNM